MITSLGPVRVPAGAPLAVGTKRGVNYGIVFDADCNEIGRVFKHSRVAAGTGGQTRPFWTAVARLSRAESGQSLGTRHRTRDSAVAAVRSFASDYPRDYLLATALTSGSPLARILGQAVAQFKYDQFQECALPYRVGDDPRDSRWAVSV